MCIRDRADALQVDPDWLNNNNDSTLSDVDKIPVSYTHLDVYKRQRQLLLKSTCPFSLFLLIIAIFSLHRKTENPITQILLTLLINTYYNRYGRKLKQVFSFSTVFLFMSKCLD